jgi:hypothetical protein
MRNDPHDLVTDNNNDTLFGGVKMTSDFKQR